MESSRLPEYRLVDEINAEGTTYCIVGKDTTIIP